MAVGYRIRPAQLADVPALARLEPRCFSDPWSEAGFREMLGTSSIFGLIADLKSGSMGGYLTRLSASGLANVTSGGGQVPAFIVGP